MKGFSPECMNMCRLKSPAVVQECATEKFFSFMVEHVPIQLTSVCAGEVTLCATERLFSRMGEHVLF